MIGGVAPCSARESKLKVVVTVHVTSHVIPLLSTASHHKFASTMMKTAVCPLLLLLVSVCLVPLASSFSPSCATSVRGQSSALDMTKKFPAGRPNTDQVDEDMAMWIEEDTKGNRKKALKKPVGGRPVDLYTKAQVEKIEQKGVSPFERLNRYMEWVTNRPTRGY